MRDLIRLLSPDPVVDAAAVAKYWDGPRIGPGMALEITVGTAATQPMENKIQVDQNGDVTLPLLKEPVACDGLTLDALKQKLVKAYSAYIRQPQVTVVFGPWDPQSGVSPYGKVTVMGEVTRPGPVNMPATMDLTLMKAIQLAGGLKPFADKSSVRVYRCDKKGRVTPTKIDLADIEHGDFSKDILLRAGDVVSVSETWY